MSKNLWRISLYHEAKIFFFSTFADWKLGRCKFWDMPPKCLDSKFFVFELMCWGLFGPIKFDAVCMFMPIPVRTKGHAS